MPGSTRSIFRWMNDVTVCLRRAAVFVLALLCCGVLMSPVSSAQDAAKDKYIPIEELPPQDQLPAAPLLIGAYSFVALALFLYVTSVARRMTVVQREIERLEADVKRRV